MNKKDSVPHKENATRMNIQLKKKKNSRHAENRKI